MLPSQCGDGFCHLFNDGTIGNVGMVIIVISYPNNQPISMSLGASA